MKKRKQKSVPTKQKFHQTQFFNIQTQNQMHNSKKQQSFLQTGRAPQQKAAMIDFIFKRTP